MTDTNTKTDSYTGVVRTYNENTKLLEEYFMVNGKKHGEIKTYYPNGQLRDIYYCVDNIMNGEYKKYYDNGQLDTIANYNDDCLIGEVKKYYRKGYLPSQQNGPLEYYCKDASNKNREEIYYYKNGKIQEITKVINGKSKCTYHYDYKGNIIITETYK